VSEIGKTMITPEMQADVARVMALRKSYCDLFQETVELIELEGRLPPARISTPRPSPR